MKVWLFLLTALLVIPRFAFAQETPDLAEWTTEQRCVPTFTEPPDGWTFDGVIFTFRQGDGIHARRADVPMRYYVAFDSDSEFGVAGALALDGRWFAVPIGYTHRMSVENTLENFYRVEYIRVYSTAPTRQFYDYPVHYIRTGYYAVALAEVNWVDNQTLIVTGSTAVYESSYNTDIFDPFEGTAVSVILPENASLISVSPDSSRWIYKRDRAVYLLSANDVSGSEVDLPVRRVSSIHWAFDSSHFAASLITGSPSDGDRIGIFDRDGELIDAIPPKWIRSFSFAHNSLAYNEYDSTIHIADFETRTITDTCLETPYTIAFSPDGQNLAFGLEPAGYVYILDLDAWEAYRIDMAANDVIGWYPIS